MSDPYVRREVPATPVYREPVVYQEPVQPVVQQQPMVVDRRSNWTSYAFVRYSFILLITIVILFFIAKYLLPLIQNK